jgi:hypothetical protein
LPYRGSIVEVTLENAGAVPRRRTTVFGSRLMPSEQTLLAAAWRLVQAADEHEHLSTVESADAVIAARLNLQEAFVEAGWVPPRYRQEEMQRDRAIVRHAVGLSESVIHQRVPVR